MAPETPDLRPDPFAPDGDRLIGHRLRCDPQSIIGLGINGDTKIRSIHQLGSQLAVHHGGVAVRKGVIHDSVSRSDAIDRFFEAAIVDQTATRRGYGRGLPLRDSRRQCDEPSPTETLTDG